MKNRTQNNLRACNALLVVEPDGAARGVVVPLVASATPTRSRRAGRVQFTGVVPFAAGARRQIRRVIAPLVQAIAEQLGRPGLHWSVSVGNADISAVQDLALQVEGFSGDAAAFLAMLAAALDLPLPDDLAVTGHVSSRDGRIAAVGGLSAKLEAAGHHPELTRVALPAAVHENSTSEHGALNTALTERAIVGADLERCHVRDVVELAKIAFAEDAVVVASLRHGFFRPSAAVTNPVSAVERLVRWLSTEVPSQYWPLVRRYAVSGGLDVARRLVSELAKHYISRGTYPTGAGQQLAALHQSLSPALRRSLSRAPLLPTTVALELARGARPEDAADVQRLFTQAPVVIGAQAHQQFRTAGSDTEAAEAAVNLVIERLRSEALAAEIGNPLDAARACYAVHRIDVDNYDELLEAVTAFFSHLQQAVALPQFSDSADAISSEAFHLVDSACRAEGGFDAAVVEARHPVRGGLRWILDRMTEQLKRELTSRRIRAVLREAVDPLDEAESISFTRALVDRLGDQLPDHLRGCTPAILVHRREELLEACVSGLDQVTQQLRRF